MEEMYGVDMLNALSMEEQKQLKANLDQAIAETERQIKEDALNKIEELARTANLSPKDLASCLGIQLTGASKKGKLAPKYCNLASGETWTGRGRKPTWLEEQLKLGRTLDEFEIAKQSTATPSKATDVELNDHHL